MIEREWAPPATEIDADRKPIDDEHDIHRIGVQQCAAASANHRKLHRARLADIHLRHRRSHGLGEVVSPEQEPLTGRLGESVSKAVAEIKAGRMAAAFAEVSIGRARDLRVLGGH